MDILVFAVDNHRYALPARDVDQIVRAVTVTPLPGTPVVVEGVIDVHGTLVPVLDLRRRFGLPAQAPVLSDLLIIASAGARRVAVRVGENASLQKIDPTSLGRSGESLTQSPWVAGLAKLPDGIVVIHDLALFLSESESESLARALADKNGLRVA